MSTTDFYSYRFDFESLSFVVPDPTILAKEKYSKRAMTTIAMTDCEVCVCARASVPSVDIVSKRARCAV